MTVQPRHRGPVSSGHDGQETAVTRARVDSRGRGGSEPQVVVVGAGPAGSVAALVLARAGVRVLLVERLELPRWKVCGACIGPAARGHLQRLGLLDAALERGAARLDVMEIGVGTARARIPLRGNLALSRPALDELLVGAAAGAGAAVRDGVRVEGARPSADGVELSVRSKEGEDRIRTRVVVDATGLGSGLAVEADGCVGRTVEVASGSRIGLGATYPCAADGPDPHEIRMVVGSHGYIGMVRVEGGRLNVAAAVDRQAVSDDGPEGSVAALLAAAGLRLPDVEPVEPWRGTPPLTRSPHDVARARIFRVGDAAGYVEPFTGEGIGWAIASGAAVASFAGRAASGWNDALSDGWSRAHRRGIVRRQRVCRVLARALRHPRLVRAGVGALSVAPWLAAPVVEMTASR